VLYIHPNSLTYLKSGVSPIIYCIAENTLSKKDKEASLRAQEEKCRDYAQFAGYSVEKVFANAGEASDEDTFYDMVTNLPYSAEEIVILLDSPIRLAISKLRYFHSYNILKEFNVKIVFALDDSAISLDAKLMEILQEALHRAAKAIDESTDYSSIEEA